MKKSSPNIIEDFRGETLVPRELLRAITKRIVENIHPEKVILFGSYAHGEPTLDSDIDLFVIMNSDKRPIEESDTISHLFPHRHFGIDILVRTPQMVQERLALGDGFIRQIMQEGKVLYAIRNARRLRLDKQGRDGLRGRGRPTKAKKKPVAGQSNVRLRAVR
jgi:uncharacterized protein